MNRVRGVVMPDIQKPFAAIVSGIQHTVSRIGYRIVIAQSDESPGGKYKSPDAKPDGWLCYMSSRDTRD